MKKYFVALLSLLLSFTLAACGDETASNNADGEAQASEVEEANTEEGTLTLGDTFEFDNLEITFGDTIEWDTVNNEFSDYHGEEVFFVPITVTNLSDETHGLNMFFYKQFGSSGTALENVDSFFDNSITWASEMRSGATQESDMFFLYDGDGDYFVEFDDFSTQIEVKIPVTK